MRIAVIHHTANTENDYAEYMYELLEKQAVLHDFEIEEWNNGLKKKGFNTNKSYLINIITNAASSFSLRWWYAVKLPSILKKIKANLVVNMDGIIHSSIQLPQVMILENLHNEKPNSFEAFAIKQFSSYKKNNHQIIAPSHSVFQNLKVFGHDKTDKNSVIPFAINQNSKIYEWPEKLMIKAKESGNREYFLAILDTDDAGVFVMLLKAFTKFKKWQQSSMQFILVKRDGVFSDEVLEKKESYKYRDDVQLLEEVDEIRQAEIMAAAYACINLSASSKSFIDTLFCMRQQVPVLSFTTAETREYFTDKVIYIQEEHADAIGNAMLQIYKDENLKNQKSAAGFELSKEYDMDVQANKLWQIISSFSS